MTLVAVMMFGFVQSPDSARAEDIEPGSENWAPFAAIVGGVEVHDVRGASSSTAVQPPVVSVNPGNLAPPSSGDNRLYSGTVGMEFGLMSPRILDTAGTPRFFLHADVDANLSSDVQPAAERARGPIRAPRDATGGLVATFSESAVLGQGTQGIVHLNPLSVRVGAGIAFGFEYAGRRIRVKPSIEYARRRYESRFGITRVVQIGGDGSNANRIQVENFDSQTRIASVDIDFTSTLHGIGPGLEVEMDAWRSGPNVISLFASGSAYHFLGNLKETGTGMTSNPTNPSPNPIPETATFRFKYEAWAYRVGFGIRFRWQPE